MGACDSFNEIPMNTLTLLGAGASVDAGVPSSVAMTREIVASIDSPRHDYWGFSHAINYAVGAMVAHRTANGASAYAGIDVEELFSAVQMLSDRESLEVAPFVQWSPALSGVRGQGTSGSLPPFFDKNFKEGILQNRSFNQPGDMIKKAFEALSNTQSTDQIYMALQVEMLNALRKLVAVSAESVEYLGPLLHSAGIPVEIATLNYDRSVEELCRLKKRSVDTGMSAWSGGRDWEWDPNAEVRLLKLHGSIDWQIEVEQGRGGLTESKVVQRSDDSESRGTPGVVFGGRGKLRADGPFLSMLREFDNMLSRAERLLIVGYSFRDDHINVALARWVNSVPGRNMTVIDPAFNRDRRVIDRRYSFANQLENASRPAVDGTRRLNLRVVRETAKNGLALDDLWTRPPEGAA